MLRSASAFPPVHSSSCITLLLTGQQHGTATAADVIHLRRFNTLTPYLRTSPLYQVAAGNTRHLELSYKKITRTRIPPPLPSPSPLSIVNHGLTNP